MRGSLVIVAVASVIVFAPIALFAACAYSVMTDDAGLEQASSLPEGRLVPDGSTLISEDYRKRGIIVTSTSVTRRYVPTVTRDSIHAFYEYELVRQRGWSNTIRFASHSGQVTWSNGQYWITVSTGNALGIEIPDMLTVRVGLRSGVSEATAQSGGVSGLPNDRVIVAVSYPGLAGDGEPYDPQPIFLVQDGRGFPIYEDDSSLTLSVQSGPDGAVLTYSNGLTRAVRSGRAEFSGCEVDTPGQYTLVASSPGMQSFQREFEVVLRDGVLVADGPPVTVTTFFMPISAPSR